jgi:SNF2 family DNA or RNA helicase
LRRLKKNVVTLPPKSEYKVLCRLTKEQTALYQAVIDEQITDLEKKKEKKRSVSILALLTKLKQVCNHPALVLKDGSESAAFGVIERSGKLKKLAQIVKDVHESAESAIVFTQYKTMGHIIQEQMSNMLGEEVLFHHGGLNRKERKEALDAFSAKTGPAVMVLTIKSGGVGLNLQKATHVIHFDQWWNPAVGDQGTDRIYRIGQNRRVHVYFMNCVGTLEERIEEMLTRKRKDADDVLEKGWDEVLKMSMDELREWFGLRTEQAEDVD